MSMAIPFKGFVSKSAYVRDCVKRGLTVKSIMAESPELTSPIVDGLYSRAKGTGRRGNANLIAAADARGISMGKLRGRLLAVIERENMIDAILDDGIDSSKGPNQ